MEVVRADAYDLVLRLNVLGRQPVILSYSVLTMDFPELRPRH